MSKQLVGYINLDKIDKTKTFKTKSNEECVNVIVWINDNEDQYGNIASIKQSDTKVYIGNLKEPKKQQ